MPFRDRAEAGRRLAEALAGYSGRRAVVLALPRGGVPVAAPIAAALDAPLDLVLVRKVGVPWQPELAMGAVVDGEHPIVVRNPEIIRVTGVGEQDFDAVCRAELAEIERRRARYLGERKRADPAGRTAIVVDDGVATGATLIAALRAIRERGPAELVAAVPVGPPSTMRELAKEADSVVCLEQPADFGALGYFYEDFRQISDAEVLELLARHPVRPE